MRWRGDGETVEYIFFHGLIPNQVFCNDAIQHLFVNAVIPDAVGINDQERASHAYAKARGNAALDADRVVILA